MTQSLASGNLQSSESSQEITIQEYTEDDYPVTYSINKPYTKYLKQLKNYVYNQHSRSTTLTFLKQDSTFSESFGYQYKQNELMYPFSWSIGSN